MAYLMGEMVVEWIQVIHIQHNAFLLRKQPNGWVNGVVPVGPIFHTDKRPSASMLHHVDVHGVQSVVVFDELVHGCHEKVIWAHIVKSRAIEVDDAIQVKMETQML